MSEINNKTFTYHDSEEKEHVVEFQKDDFKTVSIDKKIFDVKFETKPSTFFKDAMRRFVKNKSSVIGAIILGIIVLGAVIVPMAVPSDIANAHLDQRFLEPKLFNAGTGFWDGTKYIDAWVPYDYENETPAGYDPDAVSELTTRDDTTNNASAYAEGGYLRFIAQAVSEGQALEDNVKTFRSYTFTYNPEETITVTFNLADVETTDNVNIVNGNFRFITTYQNNEGNTQTVYLNGEEYINDYKSYTFTLNDHLGEEVLSGVRVGIELFPNYVNQTQLLITSVDMSSSNSESVINTMGFDDANDQVLLTNVDEETKEDNINYWSCTGLKQVYAADITYCNFRYDTYEAIYGLTDVTLTRDDIRTYINNGWMSYDFSVGPDSFKVLDEAKCPITQVYSQTVSTGVITTYSIKCEVVYYKYLGMDSMPVYLFGTNSLGKDMFKLIFNGLRTSLLLGIGTSIINFIIGIVWGSISGYFGGTVDLVMERFTDILGRIPWIVIMTLCILYFGQGFGSFIIALCLTGWMGISGTTRAQFYRFKGREYVLASRTLGAKDSRLIFRHILPNSLGTLVTSAVFMIPSVIFTESSLSYLGLGLQGMDSFGVILSENQQFIASYTYLILIPSVIMALMMISFNLFGNGLRDAFNPSLKGSD